MINTAPEIPRGPVRIFGTHSCIVPRDRGVLRYVSYGLVIADYDATTGDLTLYEDNWTYSRTTMKYFSKFINEHTSYTYESKAKFEKVIREESIDFLLQNQKEA